ncbi:MAG: hypothetical protein H6925_02330 [Holosporaceae bacterium]|nr:MAG: hypothetical protein H6925_02330 [Holosporaceae bacterium]
MAGAQAMAKKGYECILMDDGHQNPISIKTFLLWLLMRPYSLVMARCFRWGHFVKV